MNNECNYRTVCFTGHRRFTPEEEQNVQARLDAAVRDLIENRGTVTFRTGGALGFDTMAVTPFSATDCFILTCASSFTFRAPIRHAAGSREMWNHTIT